LDFGDGRPAVEENSERILASPASWDVRVVKPGMTRGTLDQRRQFPFRRGGDFVFVTVPRISRHYEHGRKPTVIEVVV